MAGERRTRRNALLGFALVTLVILGGLAWATSATVRLAMLDINHERHAELDGRIQQAMVRLDDTIQRIVYGEGSRPYHTYSPWYYETDLYTRKGVPVEPGKYVKKSELVTGPPSSAPWIDFYFQVVDGIWSSPEIPSDDRLGWPVADQSEMRARFVMDGLRELRDRLPEPELARMVEEGLREQARLLRLPDDHSLIDLAISAREPETGTRTEYERRRLQTINSLVRNVQQHCEPADLVLHAVGAEAQALDNASSAYASVDTLPMTSFWLPTDDEPPSKLIVVRPVRVDNEPYYYQGFVIDWEQLRPRLMTQIQDLLPDATLEPFLGTPTDAESGEALMTALPAQLITPPIEPASFLAGMSTVRTTLVVTWIAALAVLTVTGFGVRNLLALSERRSQFAYAVTHELRTPLTTFRLYSDMLAAGLVPEPSKQKYLDTLNSEAQRLSKLVEQVLEYSRLENQKIRLNPVTTEATAILAGLSATAVEHCRASGVEGKVNSSIANGMKVRTDVDIVNQVAGVLINNACRHARSSPAPAVFVNLGSENGSMVIDVIDTGRGVDRKDSSRIFKPFHRGSRAEADAQGGIGLGLALARNWAELLGGELELVHRSHPQHGGAHFRLRVPTDLALDIT